MVASADMNLLFFFGVLIPALVTVALFFVFCYCWYKMRIRNEVLYKKHDPHKIERLREVGKNYEPPPPPPPPFKATSSLFSSTYNYNNNNKTKANDDYEEQPEPTEGFDNPAMYRTNPDSAFSDLNQIQCNVDTSKANSLHANSSHVARQETDMCRPNSQASDDSDDSGFRSSRSGQYIHSASSSTGNAQENTGSLGAGVHSLHVQDAVPLFKPIKIHPNDMGGRPMVSYINRNSSKHKGHRQRMPLPSSQQQHCVSAAHSESQNCVNNLELAISGVSQPHMLPVSTLAHSGHSMGQTCNSANMHQFSKSNNDVHGGRLHSIDSHVGPLTYAGNYGLKSCMDISDHRNSVHPNALYTGGQLSSIGYASDVNSLSDMNSVGYLGEKMCFSLPVTPKMATSQHIAINSYIPGYNLPSSSHIQPIHPQPTMYNIGQTHMADPRQLTITEAMVHKPYIEELSDPKLYSVV